MQSSRVLRWPEESVEEWIHGKSFNCEVGVINYYVCEQGAGVALLAYDEQMMNAKGDLYEAVLDPGQARDLAWQLIEAAAVAEQVERDGQEAETVPEGSLQPGAPGVQPATGADGVPGELQDGGCPCDSCAGERPGPAGS